MNSVLTVAVIDDDNDVREALTGLLRAAGFRPRGFESAEAFLGRLSPEPIDFLVADVRLPGMTGVELVNWLSGRGTLPNAILMTGHDDEATRTLLARTPVTCLRKPFSGESLLQALELRRIVDA